MTIYEKTTGGLVKTGQRSVTSFPSGLVRVDQLYQGKTGEEASHRSLLAYGLPMPDQADAPVIDDLIIFPEVQESKDGTGFTNYQCSAYGRTTDSYRELTRTTNTILVNPSLNTTLKVIAYDMTGTIVKRLGENIEESDVVFDESFLNLKSVSYLKYPFVPLLRVTETNVSTATPATRTYVATFDTEAEGFIEQTFYITDPFITVTAQRNFGEFVEYEFIAVRQPQENLE